MVLSTVNHLSADVLELTVRGAQGRQATIRATRLHKFYRQDDPCWVSASALRQGDRLTSPSGPVTMVATRRVPGIHRVYNLTVAGAHVYHVSSLGALVYNNGCGPRETATQLAQRLGREGELAADIAKNTQRIDSLSGRRAYRIPDELTETTLTEVKNVKYLYFSTQLQDSLHYSIMTNRQMILKVRPDTILSQPLLDAIDAGWIRLEYLP